VELLGKGTLLKTKEKAKIPLATPKRDKGQGNELAPNWSFFCNGKNCFQNILRKSCVELR
jgi:hypothetical protein